jgi:hypothetical protein
MNLYEVRFVARSRRFGANVVAEGGQKAVEAATEYVRKLHEQWLDESRRRNPPLPESELYPFEEYDLVSVKHIAHVDLVRQ